MKPAILKAELLSNGISFERSYFKNKTLKKGFYVNQYVYNKTSEGIGKNDLIPQGLCLEDKVFCSLLRRINSEITITRVENNDYLTRNGNILGLFKVPDKPGYFGKKLSDGSLIDNVVAVAGENMPGFIFYPHCQFITEGKGCSFCNVVGTRKKYGEELCSNFSNEALTESINIVFNTRWKPIDTLFITTGSLVKMDQATKSIAQMIHIIRNAIPKNVRIHLLTSPPKDLSLLSLYKESGVSTIAFNIEFYDIHFFNNLCPGKRAYIGYDHFWESLFKARAIFGDYNVYCGFVWGIESIESTYKGYEKCLDNGISISSNIFHSDPNTKLRNHPHPSTDTIIELCRKQSELYLRYPESTSLFNCSMRSTLDFEIYRGDFK